MAKRKKLNSKNPKYKDKDIVADVIKKEILINNIKGVKIKAVWYE